MRLFKKIEGKKGIALIMALWIMTILLVVAASFAFMMRTEIKMAKNYRDGMKAHYLALAGVEHAIAMLTNDQNNVDHLYEDWFTTFAEPLDGDTTDDMYRKVVWKAKVKSLGGDGTYAVHLSDENSKYNLNYPNRSGLNFLVTRDGTTDPPVSYKHKICGIKDYVDSDLTVQDWDGPRGYELAGVTQKPFETVYEIQKVRGQFSTDGYTINDGYIGAKVYDNPLDILLDASGNKRRGDESDMTVYSRDYNTPVGGSSRVDANTCAAGELVAAGFTAAEETVIINNRNYADHTYPWVNDPNEGEGIGAVGYKTTANKNNVSEQSMMDAADNITVGNYDSGIIQGAVNINTGTLYGLQTLFNIEDVKGQAIIDTRRGAINCMGPDAEPSTGDECLLVDLDGRTNSYFAQRGELLTVFGIDKGIFQDSGDFVTVRSDRFRIYSIGKVGIDGNSDGDLEDPEDTVFAARKIEAVVDRHYHDLSPTFHTPGPIEVLYWSERVFAD